MSLSREQACRAPNPARYQDTAHGKTMRTPGSGVMDPILYSLENAVPLPELAPESPVMADIDEAAREAA